jgi:glycosyltransferase involved in cell wall biosynthesis
MSSQAKMVIDVCMPTWNSGEVLARTLDKLAISEEYTQVGINRLILVDNLSDDGTIKVAESKAVENDWSLLVERQGSSLPRARQIAFRLVETPWFLFLDDDVRITKGYLQKLTQCVAPSIGAVQGRKQSSSGEPWEWSQRRVYRGGTHATLIRTTAVDDLSIPEGVKVLEDEYIRRHVESAGYIWIFNHQARFGHNSMERHQLGWKQGYIAGKYDLMPFHSIVLMIVDAISKLQNPFGRILLMAGYLYGYVNRR